MLNDYLFYIFAISVALISKFIFIAIVFALLLSLFKCLQKKINYYKQKPYFTKNSISSNHGILLANFYTYYAHRPFSRSDIIFNLLFSKRYQPVIIDIYEKNVVLNGEIVYTIDKNKEITLKKLPLSATDSGMYDLYKENINIPVFYRNYFDEIYLTDILGIDSDSKLLLTPPLAECLKKYLPYKEIIVKEISPLPIN